MKFKSLDQLFWIPVTVFIIYWVHGSLIGMTDDEAYYWVLSRDLAWGYAYHPPAIAWLLALSRNLFGWIDGEGSPIVIRFASAICIGMTVAICLRWFKEVGVASKNLFRSFLVFLSFCGVFGVAWMAVPDLPFFVGWALAFYSCWLYLFGKSPKSESKYLAGIVAGIVITLISKFYGVMVTGSVFLSLVWFLRKDRPRMLKGISACLGATLIGLIPTILWNYQNEWGALAYQFSGRHSGDVNWLRYMRFWITQIAGAGPGILIFAFLLASRIQFGKKETQTNRLSRYVFFWAVIPASVFLVQPLFSDFKPHWAIIVWFPAALELAVRVGKGEKILLAKVQKFYAYPLIGILFISCHFPLIGYMIQGITGKEPNPLWDVTNDLYGWSGLAEFVENKDPELMKLPLLASRYQTASQAAASWPNPDQVARVPRSRKERNEWPAIAAVTKYGPDWPELRESVLFVADTRYHNGPDFRQARCVKVGRHTEYRRSFMAKWIDVWKCDPTE